MAQLEGAIQITGTMSNLSFYKMRGTDKIVVRKKGGPTRKQVKHSPNFANTRRNNKEFGGRAKAARDIKRNLFPLMFLADYNITGPLNALLKPIQEMDRQSGWGKRNILLSKEARLLEGFTLNRRYLLESIVRTQISCLIEKQKGMVLIDIPALIPDINLIVPGNYNWYRFIAVAGQIPDLYFSEHGYQPENTESNYFSEYKATEWLPVNAHAPASQLTINLKQEPGTSTIMAAIGIAFGALQGNKIEPVKYVGGAKVIRAV